MKRSFRDALVCLQCRSATLEVEVAVESEIEVRQGTLTCRACGRVHQVVEGIADFLDPGDQGLRREVAGWLELGGPLDEKLVPTMTALPYYPHGEWPHLAPDFFQVFEHVDVAGARVVDLGSGRTWAARHLLTIGRAAEVVAVDVLTDRFLGLETAEVYFAEDGIFFERIRGDVHHVPLRDGWADVVFACATLHHSSDLERLFGEVRRLLRPGGVFVFVSEPCKKASIEATRPENEEAAHGINEHIYSLGEYVRPLRKLGFRYRLLSPRSVRYRLLYPDDAFWSQIPPRLGRVCRSRAGRRLLARALGRRWLQALLYRYVSLPLSVVARRP